MNLPADLSSDPGRPAYKYCAACSLVYLPSARFCRQCGRKLLELAQVRHCPHCEQEHRLQAKFCAQTGKPIPSLQPACDVTWPPGSDTPALSARDENQPIVSVSGEEIGAPSLPPSEPTYLPDARIRVAPANIGPAAISEPCDSHSAPTHKIEHLPAGLEPPASLPPAAPDTQAEAQAEVFPSTPPPGAEPPGSTPYPPDAPTRIILGTSLPTLAEPPAAPAPDPHSAPTRRIAHPNSPSMPSEHPGEAAPAFDETNALPPLSIIPPGAVEPGPDLANNPAELPANFPPVYPPGAPTRLVRPNPGAPEPPPPASDSADAPTRRT